MSDLPLTGVRVLSLEQAVAAPLATRHMVELGAVVTKVERVEGGDFARHYDGAVHGASAHFAWLNGGKRSIGLDVRHPAGQELFYQLVEASDVLVSNIASASRERMFPDDRLVSRRPDLVRCYIDGYGKQGPLAGRKAYDALVQGEAGVLATTGTPDAPAKSGISVADVGAGTYAFALVNAALLRRAATGSGARIDVALFDVLTDWLSPLLLAERNGSPPPGPAGARHATIVPYGPFRTGDGVNVNIAVQNEGQWRRFCEVVLEMPSLATAPEWAGNERRSKGRDRLEPLIERVVGGLSESAFTGRLEAADVPWGRVNSIAEVAGHDQIDAMGRWRSVGLDNGAVAEVLAAPFEIDGHRPTPGTCPGWANTRTRY